MSNSSSRKTELDRLLADAKATLHRHGSKHEVWKLPNGRLFVASVSPSDWRSIRNARSTLRRLLKETA